MTDKTIQQSLDELGTAIDNSNRLIRDLRQQAHDLREALKYTIGTIEDFDCDLDPDAQEAMANCKTLSKKAVL